MAFQQLLAEKLGVLPENVICDPPYNIGFQYRSYSDNLPESEYIEMLGAQKGMKAVIIHYPVQTTQYVVPALGVPNDMLIWRYASNLPHQARLISVFGKKADRAAVRQPYRNPNDKRVKAAMNTGRDFIRREIDSAYFAECEACIQTSIEASD